MQEARDSTLHRPRLCPCHSLPVISLPFFSKANTTIADSSTGLPVAGGNPYAERVGADVAHDRRFEPLPKIEFIRLGNVAASPMHAFPKRSDSWKNVRNSSLSIIEGVE